MKSFVLSLAGSATLSAGVQTRSDERPVTKVTNLLNDMIKQLEKEAEEDEDIYDKLACWCETYDKEKTKSIADAEAKIKDLTHKIEQLSANSGRLNGEIKVLKNEVADDQDALEQAKAVRANELAKFNQQDKELSAAIEGLNAAIQSAGGFLQRGSSFLQGPSVEVTIHRVMNLVDFDAREELQEWLNNRQKGSSELQDDAGPPPTTVQAEDETSVLKKLKQLQEAHLDEAMKEEAHNVAEFEEVKKAKEDEIMAGVEQIEQKEQALADADQKLADAREDMDTTKESMSADEKFISDLKQRCSGTDAQWEERSKTRAMEIEACHKALAVLSSDEAHAIFSSTFNPDFMQRKMDSTRREKAAKVLSAMAEKTHNPHLAAIAMQVKLDAFARVKKAIDDMMAQLTAEKNDEIKHKDFCIDEFNTNQMQTEKKESEKTNLIAEMEDLDLAIKTYTSEITTLKNEIATMQKNLKTAGENRDKENAEFQQTVADQRASQKLLKAALEILKGFYEKKEMFLIQSKQAPPPGFSDYKKSAKAGGVIGMIETIISDTKSMESEATRAEEEAANAYNNFVADTTKNIDTKNKEIVNKSEEKAKAQTNLNQATSDKENTMLELEQLSNYNAELHQECDFVMKNFEIRQEARDEEIEALRQAKGILSGSKFATFLQTLGQ
jgi:septal ring factor EnvC (AmiA/AmiB activator)